MNGDKGHCSECGGSNGLHFDDCSHEVMGKGYSRGKGGSDDGTFWKWVVFALVLYAVNPFIGTVLLLILLQISIIAG